MSESKFVAHSTWQESIKMTAKKSIWSTQKKKSPDRYSHPENDDDDDDDEE